MRLVKKPLLIVLNEHLIDYPTPSTINYMWSFGFLSGMCLLIQILTGVLLAMHYTPNVDLAFFSIEHIMRDVNNGWLIRYTHANGASFFFIVVYAHMARNLYFGSYYAPRIFCDIRGSHFFWWWQQLLWAMCFLGDKWVLGATVITNLFLRYLMQENLSHNDCGVGTWLIMRHLIVFLVYIICYLLYSWFSCCSFKFTTLQPSNNPLGCSSTMDKIPMYPFFLWKIFLAFFVYYYFFWFCFFSPNSLGHPDNYIEANAMVTPAHIVPEWYFLPFYAILRAVPDKLLGVVAMGASIAILFVIPFISKVELVVQNLEIYQNFCSELLLQTCFY